MLKIHEKLDFILIYDSWIREIESIQYLAEKLNEKGYSLRIISNHWRRYKNAIRYRPAVILLPFMYNENDGLYSIYKSLYPDAQFVNIHSEQISNSDTEVLMLPQDEAAKEVWHLVWGEDFKLKLVKSGVDPDKILITGNIRFDSLLQNRGEHKKDKSDTKRLLYPSSFGMTIMSKDYLKNVEKSIDSKKLHRQLNFMEKERQESFRILYMLAFKNPEIEIIIRPHPHVNVNLLEKTFYEDTEGRQLKNIKFEREGSIKCFFMQDGKVLVWHSTTLLEASILGKDCAIFTSSGFPSYLNMDYFKYFSQFKTYEEVEEWVIGENRAWNNADEYLKDKFYLLDGKATERVVGYLEQIKNSFDQVQRKFNLEIWIKAIIIDNIKYVFRATGLLYIIFPFFKGLKQDI